MDVETNCKIRSVQYDYDDLILSLRIIENGNQAHELKAVVFDKRNHQYSAVLNTPVNNTSDNFSIESLQSDLKDQITDSIKNLTGIRLDLIEFNSIR